MDMLRLEHRVPGRAESATSSCGKIPTITSPGDTGQALEVNRSLENSGTSTCGERRPTQSGFPKSNDLGGEKTSPVRVLEVQ